MLTVDAVMLRTRAWAIRVEREHAPRKALGLIAEHIGALPDNGAFLCRKDQPAQTMLLDEEMTFLETVEEEFRRLLWTCRLTPITLNGQQIWQDMKTLRCRRFDPDYTRIIDADYLKQAMTDPEKPDSNLFVEDEADNWVIICPLRYESDAALDHLSGFPWCGEGTE